MEYSIDFGAPPHGDVTITAHGPAAAEGLVACVNELVADPRFRPGARVLIDDTDLDFTPLQAQDVRNVAQTVIRVDERLGSSRVAIVVPSTFAFGLVRMFELLAGEAKVEVKPFYDLDDAVAWLARSHDDAPPQ
jgi:hypothetical protein